MQRVASGASGTSRLTPAAKIDPAIMVRSVEKFHHYIWAVDTFVEGEGMAGAGRDGSAARRDGSAARRSEVRQRMTSKKAHGLGQNPC